MASPHKLIVEEREGYLHVVYGADELTLEMIVQIINTVAERVRAGRYTRVLLVREAPLLESDRARTMVAAMIRNLLGDEVRFAIVDAYGNDPKAARRAAEASRRAGWNLTAFDSESEAEAWLLEG
jgi:hypothetical protein